MQFVAQMIFGIPVFLIYLIAMLTTMAGAKSPRPWVHTTNRVDPGRYSQRSTVVELNALKLNPPGVALYD